MNVVKIQQEILKRALSNKANTIISVEHEDKVVCTINSAQLFIIDKKDWFLNTEALIKAGGKAPTTIGNMINDRGTEWLTKTGYNKQCGEYKCVEFALKEELIYLDEKLLKLYDKSAEFKGTSYKAPVYLYEGEKLVGMVLPVNTRVK